MHPQMRNVVGGTMLVGAVLLAWPPVAEFVAVDACLDSGGSYNYELGVCDHEHSHSGPGKGGAISLVASLVVGLAGVALIVVNGRHS